MDQSELRKTLLLQHAELRELAAAALALAERARADAQALAELRALLARFGDALEAHNLFEERELSPILPTVHAWGALRQQSMTDLHALEHDVIRAVLADASAAPDAATVADATTRLMAELAAHMEREEGGYLGDEVLRDDLITSGEGG